MSGALELLFIMLAVGSPVIAVVFIVNYFKYKKQASADLRELKKEMGALDTKEIIEQVAMLQERVKVLESIITDKGYEVSEKIANL